MSDPTVPASPGAQPAAPRLTLRSGQHGEAVTETFYQQVGGRETFARIVHRFYRGVAGDDVLAPMYPPEDFAGAEERLLLFLEQYWGGPGTYSETRGHPRLRMRHVPFHVNPEAKERWLLHMRAALDEAQLSPMHDAAFWDYVERAALAMVNTHEPTPPRAEAPA